MFKQRLMSSRCPFSLTFKTFRSYSIIETIFFSAANFIALSSKQQFMKTANSFETLSVQSNGLVVTSFSSILKTLLRTPPISDAITCRSFNSTHKLPTKPSTAPFNNTLLPSKSQSVFLSAAGFSWCLFVIYKILSIVSKNSTGGS